MGRMFKGRPIIPGEVKGEAIVSRQGLNILATFQKAIILRQKKATGNDKNNPYVYNQPLTDKILIIPQGIGSTTGGIVLAEIACMNIAPKAIICANIIDTLTATGAVLSFQWFEKRIVVIDQVGDQILQEVKTGDKIEVKEDGTIIVEE